MIKYLHLFHTGNPKVVRDFIDFIITNFDQTEHYFLVVGTLECDLELPQNFHSMETFQDREIIKWIEKSDRVILHSLFLSAYVRAYLLCHKKQMKKIVWVAWGMDLYEVKSRYESKSLGKIKYALTIKFIKKIRYFVGIFPPDVTYFENQYGGKAKTFYAKYTAGAHTKNKLYDQPPMVRTIQEKINGGETINIMVGHQANPALEHKLILEWLAKFANHNIQVYLPLSYGDSNYADDVEIQAKKMFGSQVTVLREMLNLDDYMEFLQKMDIAIFHTKRQIGLGNLHPLMYMQKKIYTCSKGVMYKYFSECGIHVQKSEDIEHIGYDEFVADVDMSAGTRHVNSLRNNAVKVGRWKAVFDGIFEEQGTEK